MGSSLLMMPEGKGSGRNSLRGSDVIIGSGVSIGAKDCVDVGLDSSIEPVWVIEGLVARVDTCAEQAVIRLTMISSERALKKA
jgi:hypothetical protein